MSDLTSPLPSASTSTSGLSDTTFHAAYGLNVTDGSSLELNLKQGGLISPEPELFGSNPNVDEVGNHWQEALLLTSNQFQDGVATVEDWIGVSNDSRDVYRFDVLVGGEVTVALGGLSDNANLQLSDANGQRIKASYRGGTDEDIIQQNLAAGTYYASVLEKDDLETPYSLRLEIPVESTTNPSPSGLISVEPTSGFSGPDPSIDLGGDSLDVAAEMVAAEGLLKIQDWVGIDGDRQDFYRFEVNQPGAVSIMLGGMSDNANLQLFDGSGNRLNASYQGGTKEDAIQRELDEGTYYLRVFGKTSDVQTAYQLSVETPTPPEVIALDPINYDSQPPVTPVLEPVLEPEPSPAPISETAPEPVLSPEPVGVDVADDSRATAQALTLESGQGVAQDRIGFEGDRKDYYRFELQEAGDVTLTLGNLTANANFQLMDASGQRIGASYAGGTKDDVIQRALEAGTYYVSIFGKDSSVETNYQLSIDAPAEPVTPKSDSEATDTAEPQTIEPQTVEPQTVEPEVVDPEPAQEQEPTPSAVDREPSDDTKDTAQTLSFAQDVAATIDSIGFGIDSKDYYRFSLEQAGEVQITLSGLSNNANLSLFDGNGQRLKSSYAGGSNDDIINQTLAAGDYYVSVFEKDSNTETEYALTVDASLTSAEDIPDTGEAVIEPVVEPAAPPTAPIPSEATSNDWFSNNIKDVELQELARDRFQDGKIDRNDMIELLRSVGDLNEVDGTEFNDLKTLVNASDRLKLDDHVRVLADKVVNGDRANGWYTGGERSRQDLGNLDAGSAQEKLDLLINKWFIGSDRPTTLSSSHEYQYIEGDLFKDGIDFKDVVQDRLGDCYFLVVLASAAQNNPDAIKDMFIDNGDGTFTIRFFKNGVADYVTVDRYLPTQGWNGESPYSQFGSFGGDGNELWVALAEKAYAQINESGWIGQDGTNTYRGIEGGWMSSPTRQVLGTSSVSSSITSTRVSPDKIREMIDSNEIITVGIVGDGKHGVVDNHAYTLTSYDVGTDTFHLENPWGEDHVDLRWEQMDDMNLSFIWSDSV